jgi:hypothetical protein
MIRITRRHLAVSPLALFVVGVLLIDAVAVAAFLRLTLNGRVIDDWFSFYTAGTLVRTGHAAHLYDVSAQAALQRALMGPGGKTMGYTLPMFIAVLFAPLSRLSVNASYLVWMAINLSLLAVLLRLSWSWLERVPEALRAVFLVSAVSVTALEVLMEGQVDLFVIAGFAGCYALLRADRPFTAGSILTIALVKPHLAAVVVLLLLVKGQWRALAGFLAVGGPLMIGPAFVFGPHVLIDQIRLLLSFTSTTTDYGVNAHMMINIRGTVTSLTGSSNVWLWLPLLALIAAVAFYVALRVWTARPALHPQSWALAFTLPLLYSPHVHVQSLVLLIGAAGLYLAESQSSAHPVTDIKSVLYPLIAITVLWSLNLSGVSLIAFLVMAAYALFSQRWPEPAVEAAIAPHQVELALAS